MSAFHVLGYGEDGLCPVAASCKSLQGVTAAAFWEMQHCMSKISKVNPGQCFNMIVITRRPIKEQERNGVPLGS